jgi:predicted MPP superfamily phosphohydrolase
VSLILHLSDVHLGSPSSRQPDSTDKFGLDPATLETVITHLERTLRSLGYALNEEGRKLDAIIVSGDLTNANKSDGYELLTALLEELGAQLPCPERILIVPGNHDADWDVEPGDPAKFARFADLVRPDYNSPLISGLDYDETTVHKSTSPGMAAKPILELEDTTIVAFNSADYCGVREHRTTTDWSAVLAGYLTEERASSDAVEQAKASETYAQAEVDLRRLRVQDMARIEPRQLDALRNRVAGTSLELDADDDPHLRIAVLHHPIGPVTGQEEIKAFETMTNLETFRSFLFDMGFHVVAHGHKHESYKAWDWLLPAGDDLERRPWRTLVLGAPGEFRVGRIVCRLLEVSPDGDQPVAGAPRVRTIDVRGVRSAQSLGLDFAARPLSLAQPFMHSTEIGMPWVVHARTGDAAYQQLRDLPTEQNLPRVVVSVVDDVSSVRQLPSNYKVDQDDEWLERIVTWWQHPRPEAVNAYAGAQFNHGQRLYGNGTDEQNAIKRAALALPSSKAIALLIDRDEAGNSRLEYPALTAVQLQARQERVRTLIDVVGIYRKQDLSLWWPVNMAELARIQTIALEAAESNLRLGGTITAGRLIAQATNGLHENFLPQMAGTVLDRAVDLDPDLPHRLALLTAQPNEHTTSEWSDALADIGSIEGKKVLVPSIGLVRLMRAMKMHHDIGGTPAAFDPVYEKVGELQKESARAVAELKASSSNRKRQEWASILAQHRQEIRAAVQDAVTQADIP